MWFLFIPSNFSEIVFVHFLQNVDEDTGAKKMHIDSVLSVVIKWILTPKKKKSQL